MDIATIEKLEIVRSEMIDEILTKQVFKSLVNPRYIWIDNWKLFFKIDN